MPRPGITQEKIERIIALRQQGNSQREIRKATGISKSAISRICQHYEDTVYERKDMPWWFWDFKIKWESMRKKLGKT